MATVLVVDDEPSIRTLVCEALKEEGYNVLSAEHGAQALAIVRGESAPDAIVTDLMMPVLDGWGFIERCRKTEGCDQIPIMVMSAAHSLSGETEHLRKCGVQAHLTKPFDLGALINLLHRFLAVP